MAAHITDRVITLRLQRQTLYGERVERYITYNGSKLDLTSAEYDDILSKIPSVWNSDKDRLIYFVLFADKTYLAQRVKDVYNYGIRETEEKLYNFDEATEAELNSFVAFLTDFYTKTKIKRTDNFYDAIVEKVTDISYMKYQLLEMRESQLKSTDYLLMPDYPISDEDRAMWVNYRQELRDITEQQAWKDNDFQLVKIPVSPRPKNQIIDMFNMVGSAYANAVELPETLFDSIKENLDGFGISEIIEKWTEISIKVEVLRGISKLKMPMGVTTDELTAIDSLLPKNVYSLLPEDQIDSLSAATKGQLDNWRDYLESVDDKIKYINSKLENLNADFTLADVIQRIADDIKVKADQHDAEMEAMRLLEDLTIEEITGGE